MQQAENLLAMQCVPCHGGEPKLSQEEVAALQPQVPAWSVTMVDGVPHLERVLRFPNFAAALAFTDAVGALAEREGHHPALTTEWGKVTVAWWTHAIRGLHRNDFIMAAKTDALYEPQPSS
jgi:4a-hydroxytetrahydrobiopterin dehydratase